MSTAVLTGKLELNSAEENDEHSAIYGHPDGGWGTFDYGVAFD